MLCSYPIYGEGDSKMALIDDLTKRISSELEKSLNQAIRSVLENYFIGGRSTIAAPAQPAKTGRRRRGRRGRSAKSARAARNQKIIDVVAKLGEASIEQVAKETGLDKRGVGSSLYYLSQSGRLKNAGKDKYKAAKAAK